MKTAIKLILIYFGFQIVAAVVMKFTSVIYTGAAALGDFNDTQSMTLALSMLLSMFAMCIYLWKAGYISTEKVSWSAVSPFYLVLTIIIYAAALLLMDFLLSYVHLPDIMEASFDQLESSWIGIFSVVILGPILEELMFRGAITKALLARYKPGTAILLSALIFGVFHLNPAQIVSAFMIGLILGWIYYKTASLIPCILIHIMNNGLAIYLSKEYPDIENFSALFTEQQYIILMVVAAGVFALAFLLMNKTTIPYPWKKAEEESEIENII